MILHTLANRLLLAAAAASLVFGTALACDQHPHGAQHLYGVTPDLSTFGKAMANGFSVSALCGRRDIMRLGGGVSYRF